MSDRLSTIHYVPLHFRNANILNVKPLLADSTTYAHMKKKKYKSHFTLLPKISQSTITSVQLRHYSRAQVYFLLALQDFNVSLKHKLEFFIVIELPIKSEFRLKQEISQLCCPGNINGNEQYLAHMRAKQSVNNLLSFLGMVGAMLSLCQ